MPTKKHIITIAVLGLISMGLGYWYGMPKEGSGGGGGKKEPEFLKQGLVAYYPFNGNDADSGFQLRLGALVMSPFLMALVATCTYFTVPFSSIIFTR